MHGFTRAVFGAVLDHCFADPGVRRVVVEPDARNEPIRALNRAFGFREARDDHPACQGGSLVVPDP